MSAKVSELPYRWKIDWTLTVKWSILHSSKTCIVLTMHRPSRSSWYIGHILIAIINRSRLENRHFCGISLCDNVGKDGGGMGQRLRPWKCVLYRHCIAVLFEAYRLRPRVQGRTPSMCTANFKRCFGTWQSHKSIYGGSSRLMRRMPSVM